MTKPGSSLADQLLERHVKHELEALTSERFVADTGEEVDALFTLCERLTLKDVVSSSQIETFFQRNVVDVEVHTRVLELAREMAARVRTAPIQQKARLKDLLSRQQAAEFVDQLLRFRKQREHLVEELLEHPLYQELVAELVYHGITNYLDQENLFGKNIPGIAATMKLGKRMFDKAAPGLDATLERSLKAYIGRNLPFLVRQSQLFINGALTDEELKDSVMTLWDKFEDKTLADLQAGVSGLELRELAGRGYGFWQRFRQSDYFKDYYQAIIDQLFRKYGDESLRTLIADMGVTPARVKAEIERSAPVVLGALREQGYLEQMLRRRLAAFYHSDSTLSLLEGELENVRKEAAPKPKAKPKAEPRTKPKAEPKAKPKAKPKAEPKPKKE